MKLALLGNPNSGKTSLFNQLTGLNQKVGNFPGVTVDKISGTFSLPNGEKCTVIDLPGTYSIHPASPDEQVVLEILLNTAGPDFPEMLVYVIDASNLRKSLLFLDQIKELGIKTIALLNQVDIAGKQGKVVDVNYLSSLLGIPIFPINARTGTGIKELKKFIFSNTEDPKDSIAPLKLPYVQTLLQLHFEGLHFLSLKEKEEIKANLDPKLDAFHTHDTLERFKRIGKVIKEAQKRTVDVSNTGFLDGILLHKFWGYFFFAAILFFIFQAVFSLASYPQDWIDAGIASTSSFLVLTLPESLWTDLLVNGILAGIGGILVFVPQIAILFAFIALLEETGYMARVIVLMDRMVRKFGLSGRSVIPLISGMACAVPAILSTRTIGNWKERIITIMVTPLTSCSARLPIYTILIALVVPDQLVWGAFNLQGIALAALYVLGMLMAILVAGAMNFILKNQKRPLFFMEMPAFRPPRWGQVVFTVYEKCKTFVLEAGKVILVISMVLWVLGSFGPEESFGTAENRMVELYPTANGEELENLIASEKLKTSYAGIIGQFIEPAIKPLGYDWKIGIAILASFAAREVFVGTVSTIYSIGSKSEEPETIKDRLKKEKNAAGELVYTKATAFSLLIFYVFAMMCMSTLAVVKRETKSWKWPIIQFVYMSFLAYGGAFLVYNLLI